MLRRPCRRTRTLQRGMWETPLWEPRNCSASVMLIVESNVSREMLTPQLTDINHLLRGKTHEITLRSGVVWEAHDFSRSPLAKGYQCLLKWGGAPCSLCTAAQPRSAGRNYPQIHSHKLYVGIFSKHTGSTIKGLYDSFLVSGMCIMLPNKGNYAKIAPQAE